MALDPGSLLGAGATIAGGILGQNAASGDRGQARDASILQNQILQEIQAAPDVSKPLILQKYQQAGLLTPEMQNNIIAQMPQNIQANPQIQQAQMQALQQMQQ